MTKKSQARQQRDNTAKELAKLRNNPKMEHLWNEIQGYYDTALKAIVQYSNMGKQLLEHQHLVKYLTNPGETRDATTTLSNDLKRFKDMFDKLREEHKDKTGRPKDNDDMVVAIDLTQRYGEAMEAMNTICAPVAQALADDFQVAQDRHAIATGGETRTIADAMANGKDLKVVIEEGAPKVTVVDVDPNVMAAHEVVMVDKAAPAEAQPAAENQQ